ncbi:MAG: hypothetical protein KC466_06865 [Myxococcales bacterium]|nr:hypothetical protein [Myxococcales bacterium]
MNAVRTALASSARRRPLFTTAITIAATSMLAPAALAAGVALTGCPDSVDVGRSFNVGLVIDTGGDDLGGYQAVVTFDGGTLNATSIVGGSTPPYTRIGVVNIWNDRNTASLASMELAGLPRGRVHVATLTFRAARAGGTTISANVGQIVNGANDEIGRGIQGQCNVTIRPASEPAPQAGGTGMPSQSAPASPYAPSDAPPQTVSTAEAYGTSAAVTRREQAARESAPAPAPAETPEKPTKRELTARDIASLYDPRTYTEAPPVPADENPLVIAARARSGERASGSATTSPGAKPAPAAPTTVPTSPSTTAASAKAASAPTVDAGSKKDEGSGDKDKKGSDVLFDADDCRCSTRPVVDDGHVHLNFLFGGLMVLALGARRALRRPGV